MSELRTGEKRRYPRIKVTIYVDWGFTAECGQQGRITSISVGGCFVQALDEVRAQEQIYIRLCLPDEHLLRGEIRYHLPDVGFGVEFKDMTIEDQLMLESVIASYQK